MNNLSDEAALALLPEEQIIFYLRVHAALIWKTFFLEYTFKVEELKKSETGRKTKLPKGQIDNITPRGHEDHRIQSVYFGNEGFITADHDGLVSLRAWDGITASESELCS